MKKQTFFQILLMLLSTYLIGWSTGYALESNSAKVQNYAEPSKIYQATNLNELNQNKELETNGIVSGRIFEDNGNFITILSGSVEDLDFNKIDFNLQDNELNPNEELSKDNISNDSVLTTEEILERFKRWIKPANNLHPKSYKLFHDLIYINSNAKSTNYDLPKCIKGNPIKYDQFSYDSDLQTYPPKVFFYWKNETISNSNDKNEGYNILDLQEDDLDRVERFNLMHVKEFKNNAIQQNAVNLPFLCRVKEVYMLNDYFFFVYDDEKSFLIGRTKDKLGASLFTDFRLNYIKTRDDCLKITPKFDGKYFCCSNMAFSKEVNKEMPLLEVSNTVMKKIKDCPDDIKNFE
ncbi:hypothetical protein GVAV_000640 [Gurleya vavrai]